MYTSQWTNISIMKYLYNF